MGQEESVLNNITFIIFLVWCCLKSFVTGPCLQKLKGSPVMTRVITDGRASAARDTLLAGTRDEGEKWIPCCAGVITALASILLFIPEAGPGANHATPFPFSLNHPSLLPTNQHMTAGRKQCKKRTWSSLTYEWTRAMAWPLLLATATFFFFFKKFIKVSTPSVHSCFHLIIKQ